MPRQVFSVTKGVHGRRGVMHTYHGDFATPAFMPIATRGAVKTLGANDVGNLGANIILSNTYHLYLRPGLSVLKKNRGLHEFMNWKGPILTDSGGYQVFSLSSHRTITEKGVTFKDTITGALHALTPEKVIDIQQVIGSDIMMVLDECPPYPTTRTYAKKSLDLTTRWALRALEHKKKKKITRQKLFAIVQGATFSDLRKRHAQELAKHDFDGFAIGGLAVGEPASAMYTMIKATVPYLPKDKPRYLMGVGYPEQIVKAVQLGIDMFDCVLPTRNARHGSLFVWKNQKLKGTFYGTIHLKNSKFEKDTKVIDPLCDCPTCASYSRSYVRHLLRIGEPLGARLLTIHNVHFYLKLMELLRKN